MYFTAVKTNLLKTIVYIKKYNIIYILNDYLEFYIVLFDILNFI